MHLKLLSLLAVSSLLSGTLLVSDSFAVDFRDSTGYTPSWAPGKGFFTVAVKCSQITGDFSRDDDWCMEWRAYVLDQGIENFPQSTFENTQPRPQSTPEITLEEGPQYTGKLTKFLPKEFTYGETWLVGRPYSTEITGAMRDQGIRDSVDQKVVIPARFEGGNYMILGYKVVEAEDHDAASQAFSGIKKAIKSLNFPTESEFYELADQGVSKDKMELEKSAERFVADCTGAALNVYKEEEIAFLTCVKDNYVITAQAEWKYDFPIEYFASPQDAVEDYTKVIINNIDNELHGDPRIKFSSDAKKTAFQYSADKLTDDELLDYLQKGIDAGEITFPTASIEFDEVPKRLSYIPDWPKLYIASWAEDKTTDSDFVEVLGWLVWHGYLAVPGFELGPVTTSSEQRESPDISEEKEPSSETRTPQESEDSETSLAGVALAVLVALVGLVIIGLVAHKRQKRAKIQETEGGKWRGV